MIRLPVPPSSSESFARDERGSLEELIGVYKETLPGEGSHAFVQPREPELRSVVEAVRLALGGDLPGAGTQLGPLGYDLALFRDSSAGPHLALREQEPGRRCWGIYLLNLSSGARDAVVQVPHPIWDVYTPELGIEAYLRLQARAFFMAGSHRYANGRGDGSSSDMARNPRSLFQALHVELTGPETRVLQYHGFSVDGHPGYPNAVISNGSPSPHPDLPRLARATEARGESVGVFDGQSWAALGATGNRQGRHTREIQGRFFHLEYRYGIRRDPRRRAAMVDAVVEVLTTR